MQVYAVTVGICSNYRGALELDMEFGAVMNRIQAVSGATTDQLAAMNAKALELGATLPISAKDAADGMYALVMAGYSAEAVSGATTEQLIAMCAKAIAERDLGVTTPG